MTKSDLETEELLLYRRPQRDHSIRAVIRAVLDTSVPACGLLLDHSAPIPSCLFTHSLHTLHSLGRSPRTVSPGHPLRKDNKRQRTCEQASKQEKHHHCNKSSQKEEHQHQHQHQQQQQQQHRVRCAYLLDTTTHARLFAFGPYPI